MRVGDGGLDAAGSQAEVVGLDVGEDRRRTGQRHRVGGRREGERRHDDLVARADAGGEQAEVQAGRAGVDGDAGAAADRSARANSVSKAATSGPWASHAAAQHAVDGRALVVADDRLGGGDEVAVIAVPLRQDAVGLRVDVAGARGSARPRPSPRRAGTPGPADPADPAGRDSRPRGRSRGRRG